MTHVFLSPHPDDAVLSCGGTIGRLSQQGEKVLVVTVMAGDPPDPLPDTPIVRDLLSRWGIPANAAAVRREEDRASAAMLGARVEHCAILDCIYRTAHGVPLYATEDSLFGAVHADDPAPDQLSDEPALSAAVSRAATLYVPLGVGHHVDHQIVRDWALGLVAQDSSLAIKFYEEYPYTRDAQAVQRALARLPRGCRAEAQAEPLDEAAVEAKIRAISCHRSQIGTFWNGFEAMAQDVRRVFAVGGAYAEQFWNIRSDEGSS